MGEETRPELVNVIYADGAPSKYIPYMPDPPEFIHASKRVHDSFANIASSIETLEFTFRHTSEAMIRLRLLLHSRKKMRWRNALLAADRMRKCSE